VQKEDVLKQHGNTKFSLNHDLVIATVAALGGYKGQHLARIFSKIAASGAVASAQ